MFSNAFRPKWVCLHTETLFNWSLLLKYNTLLKGSEFFRYPQSSCGNEHPVFQFVTVLSKMSRCSQFWRGICAAVVKSHKIYLQSCEISAPSEASLESDERQVSMYTTASSGNKTSSSLHLHPLVTFYLLYFWNQDYSTLCSVSLNLQANQSLPPAKLKHWAKSTICFCLNVHINVTYRN